MPAVPRVRILLGGGAALLGCVLVPGVHAASRAAPGHRRLAASDGGTYLLVSCLPQGGGADAPPTFSRAELVLVRRTVREGGPEPLPALEPERLAFSAPPLTPGPHDVVLARWTDALPVEAFCLPGSGGGLAVDDWSAPGQGRAAERRDAQGRLRWTRTLAELFTPAELSAFPSLHPGHRLWLQACWLDEPADDLVLLCTGPRILRLALADGQPRAAPDVAGTLLARVAAGDGQGGRAQRAAWAACQALALPGLPEALARGLRHPGTEARLRGELAARLVSVSDDEEALAELLRGLAAAAEAGTREWVAGVLREALPRRGAAFRRRALVELRGLSTPEAQGLARELTRGVPADPGR